MYTPAELADQVRAYADTLISTLERFPDDGFNAAAADGGWSGALVAEHLQRVDKGILKMVTGDEHRAVDRPVDQKVQAIHESFLESPKKYTAFGNIIPKGRLSTVAQAIEELKTIYDQLIQALPKLDLAQEVTSFEHPLFGPLTNYEWVHFLIIHGKRHLRQLDALLA